MVQSRRAADEVEYARPESVAEALQLLAQHDNARAPAGGQTLVKKG